MPSIDKGSTIDTSVTWSSTYETVTLQGSSKPTSGAAVKARLNTYLRKQPAPHSPRQEPVRRNDELVVISDPDDPPVQIGQKGDWVYVETANGERGWLPSGALVAKK